MQKIHLKDQKNYAGFILTHHIKAFILTTKKAPLRGFLNNCLGTTVA